MSALTDLLLATTDPVTAIMLVGLYIYVRSVKNSIHDDIDGLTTRISRLEGAYIPDGGKWTGGDD